MSLSTTKRIIKIGPVCTNITHYMNLQANKPICQYNTSAVHINKTKITQEV